MIIIILMMLIYGDDFFDDDGGDNIRNVALTLEMAEVREPFKITVVIIITVFNNNIFSNQQIRA